MLQGDCLEVLRALPDDCIDALVTDPPAAISFMGAAWDDDRGGRDAWVAWMTEVASECHRVLKPGAHGLVWALPRTSHWTAWALENAGFEIRDSVLHVFAQGFPKSHNVGVAIDRLAGAKRPVVGTQTLTNDIRGNQYGGHGPEEARWAAGPRRHDPRHRRGRAVGRAWDGPKARPRSVVAGSEGSRWCRGRECPALGHRWSEHRRHSRRVRRRRRAGGRSSNRELR